MAKAGESILQGAREALAYARGDHTGCCTTTYWIPLIPGRDEVPFDEPVKPKPNKPKGDGGTAI